MLAVQDCHGIFLTVKKKSDKNQRRERNKLPVWKGPIINQIQYQTEEVENIFQVYLIFP